VLKHIKSSESWNEKNLGAKGFTLIELLVVIVILGILGAVVVFSVRGVTNDAQNNACKTERRTLATAIESYYAKYGNTTGLDIPKLKTVGLIRPDSDSNYSVSGDTINGGGKCPA